MEIQKFVMLILSKSLTISRRHRKVTFDVYRQLASLTKYINYGCKFDKYGSCYRRSTPLKRPAMNCCGGCFNNIGYLRIFPSGNYWMPRGEDRLKHLKVYAKHFSDKKVMAGNLDRRLGFWRPGKGCVLPRAYRSSTCLNYACQKSNETSTVWEMTLAKLINGNLQWPIIIEGEECYEGDVVEVMKDWRKQLKTKEKKHGKKD